MNRPIKVLFVDIAVDGHHLVYLQNLLQSSLYQSVVCLPERCEEIKAKQYLVKLNNKKNIFSYMQFLNSIVSIADAENVDLIQFMQMDSLMKYFSFGLESLKKYEVTVVYHHFWAGILRRLSYRLIDRRINMAVVHTQANADKIKSYGINKIRKFEYPAFGKKEDRSNFHKPRRMLAFGDTRYDKGLDILLEALKRVDEEFILYIAGKDTYFSKEYIINQSKQYKEKICLDLQFISDEKKEKYFAETDIVILPYRRIFDGASGPLGEGVIKEKVIIGPNHGSIGRLIEENHIGYVFDSEDSDSLAKVLTKAIQSEFVYDKTALEYKDSLSPERMRREYEHLFLDLLTENIIT